MARPVQPLVHHRNPDTLSSQHNEACTMILLLVPLFWIGLADFAVAWLHLPSIIILIAGIASLGITLFALMMCESAARGEKAFRR